MAITTQTEERVPLLARLSGGGGGDGWPSVSRVDDSTSKASQDPRTASRSSPLCPTSDQGWDGSHSRTG